MSDDVTVELVSYADVAYQVREFVWRRCDGKPWVYQPGQYVNVRVPTGIDYEPLVTRAYSICHVADASSELRFVANLVPEGQATPRLFALDVGAQLQMSEPLGSFVLNEQSTRRCLFVATGTGIAPLRAMLQHLYATKPAHEAILLWGLRSERDIYYMDELQAMAVRHANFTFEPCLSQPQGEWQGMQGRVTTHLPELVKSVENLEAYVCGNQGMIEEVRGYLKSLGLCPVRTEKFY